MLLLALALYLGLHGSLARLDEWAKSAVGAPVEPSRDAQGYVSSAASSRIDASRALGYLHAQERFFQMDLLRHKLTLAP